MSKVPNYTSKNFEFIGYHDLNNKPIFKMAIQKFGSKWYLYGANFWRPYVMVFDVTVPENPIFLNEFIAGGPKNTQVFNLQVANGLMITAKEKLSIGWGGLPDQNDPSFDEGISIWDVKTDPANPRFLSTWKTGGLGTHRNFFAGDGFVHLAARIPGYIGFIYIILDIRDPLNPHEIGRWFMPEQYTAGGGQPDDGFYTIDSSGYKSPVYRGLHGPAHVENGKAYLSYGTSGAVILDVSNYNSPALLSRLTFGNAIGNSLGVHTYLPLHSRNLAVISGEALAEDSKENISFAFLADISNPSAPRVISFFPVPVPHEGASFKNFQTRGGRFGPHNWHHQQLSNPDIFYSDTMLFNAYFNAGLRAFDISDPYVPKEAGFFLADDPLFRNGPKPISLTTSAEDVLIDSRGYIYLSDKNHGVFILKYAPGTEK